MSEVKVNKLTPRTNCGTVTLGDSGDSFTIPAGATITGGGGGGMGSSGPPGQSSAVSGNGGSGIVIIRYKFQ